MELNRFNAPLICGTADCQGFQTSDSFSVAEMALKSSSKCDAICYLFRPKTPFRKLSRDAKRTSLWLTKNYHCIPYDANIDAMPQPFVIPTLQDWYKRNMVKDRPFIATMNPQMEALMKQAGIPYVMCGGDERHMPSTPDLMAQGRERFKNRASCEHHAKQPLHKIKVCAKEKALYLEDCLNNRIKPLVFGIKSDVDHLSDAFNDLDVNDNQGYDETG